MALTFTSAIDEPARFPRARAVGAHFGLTPIERGALDPSPQARPAAAGRGRHLSGETDVVGAISRVGDEAVRTALYQAAHAMLTRSGRFSSLKRWGLEVAGRRGLKRATVALARKLAVAC